MEKLVALSRRGAYVISHMEGLDHVYLGYVAPSSLRLVPVETRDDDEQKMLKCFQFDRVARIDEDAAPVFADLMDGLRTRRARNVLAGVNDESLIPIHRNSSNSSNRVTIEPLR